jgi:hypothetical protein
MDGIPRDERDWIYRRKSKNVREGKLMVGMGRVTAYQTIFRKTQALVARYPTLENLRSVYSMEYCPA